MNAISDKAQRTLALGLLVLITIPLLTKIFTSDFGTHIAIGREIVRTLSIPDREFLNYPSLGMVNPNGEWGFQAILYLVHAAGGEYAVSFFCWAVVFAIFLLLHHSMVLRGAHPLLAVVAIFAFSGFLRIRIQPRPEILTYLFIALTIALLTEYHYGTRKRLLHVLPALILLWANVHPTYLMAFLLIGAFFVDALARAAWRRELGRERLKGWIFPPMIAGILGLLLCGLNPHGYDAILTPLHLISRGATGGGGSPVLMSISELTPVKGTSLYAYYKAAAALAAVSLALGALGRRIYFLDILLGAMAFKGAWDSARAVSMMGLFLSAGVSLHLTGFLERAGEWFRSKAETKAREAQRRMGKKERRGGSSVPAGPGPGSARTRLSRGWAATAAVVAVSFVAFGGTTLAFSFSQLQFGVGMTAHKFSFAGADFLRRNPVPGNMFNFFDIGGFLDWQLYPQALTFIDGRTYNKEVFLEHQTVTGAQPGWEMVLDKHKVTHVVLKAVDSSGSILPIMGPLSASPDWALVFSDGLFLVFARRIPANADYLRRHEIPKSAIPRHIIRESYHYTYLGVSPVLAYLNMSNMYLLLGDREGAVRSLRTALDHDDHPFLRARLAELERGRGTAPHGGAR